MSGIPVPTNKSATVEETSALLSWEWHPSVAVASGGTSVYDENGWRVHIFETSDDGPFVVNQTVDVEYLVIAGGGPGGRDLAASGGGAGGLKKFVAGESGNTGSEALTLEPGEYPIVIGAGGTLGANGSNTTAFGLECDGGGYGVDRATDGVSGGSGSGSGGNSTAGGTEGVNIGTPGSGISPQGHDGGRGWRQADGGSINHRTGGGGGGAGGEGDDAFEGKAGDGGVGKKSSITGEEKGYAGGGGGAARTVSGQAIGVDGGGSGSTSHQSPDTFGEDGEDGTGGGGGASSQGPTNSEGNGGDGIVIVRYQL